MFKENKKEYNMQGSFCEEKPFYAGVEPKGGGLGTATLGATPK